MSFYVYILYAGQFDRFYVGQCNDMDGRLSRHNSGSEKSTAPYRPWELLWHTIKSTRSEAMILERKLKNLSKQRIKAFIEKYKE
jgi:putative endonuclease